ncbi:uncharacterized protein PHACADRAFT_185699 [Phanerochaete carnosa HHB-10118-sp]|uniref:FHA domain-containing protein n=1 Tax=Phanerochaete carnosa (strain HHB-10118-sp) TaxID=650164 RepID=K5VTQ1_PHACS|nr:uncharacterized protein PHACADRAFT_185699 [Phanerochaete carnosa HHB-10118-sp]EKM54863.1 hypothetical protein PHACADRAFT_185699 [Phanerochaete carnosa HHB-10118-sp]
MRTTQMEKMAAIQAEPAKDVPVHDGIKHTTCVVENPIAFLKPVAGLKRGGTLRILSQQHSTVGRDASNDFVIDHPFVADEHAVLGAKQDGTVTLQPARNELLDTPTYVNDRLVAPDERIVLESRDMVTLGARGYGRPATQNIDDFAPISEYVYVDKTEYLLRGRRASILHATSRGHSHSRPRGGSCATGPTQSRSRARASSLKGSYSQREIHH